MNIARIFQSGNSQALRLPKAFRFQSSEVEIFRRGDEVVLRERRGSVGESLAEAFAGLPPMPADFFANGRRDAPAQTRARL
ncbi:MAG TPA: type II toxin-antitoxin system VapB family antitoxin [Rhodanobacteraceae bacterium]|nr:type II toxin-antitoxin system VapB family antitoxin [Rhodanobacteraceae bacterium]